MTTVATNAMRPELMTAMNPAKKGGGSGVENAQDRFMTLLVTQMKNQDPLNPMENAQVTSQLAQLSTVTGIDKLNATLESLKGNFQSNQALQAAGMIGRSVLAPGNGIELREGKGNFGVELSDPADKLEVTVADRAGNIVRKMGFDAQPKGIVALAWDGLSDNGEAVDEGEYRFSVEALQGTRKVAVAGLALREVTSVLAGAQGVRLSLQGMGEVRLEDIRRIE